MADKHQHPGQWYCYRCGGYVYPKFVPDQTPAVRGGYIVDLPGPVDVVVPVGKATGEKYMLRVQFSRGDNEKSFKQGMGRDR